MSRVNQHSFHVVPSVSGLPETAFGTHDVSWSVPRCAKGGRATPVSSDVRHQPVAQPAVVATTRPVCCGANKAPVASNRYPNQPSGPCALSQEEESTVSRGRPVGICSGPYPLTSRQWAGGRTRCYTVRGLCISTLHVSLIIRVLPRAESATGCIFRQRWFCAGAIHVQGRYFRSIRRALRGSDSRAEVQRKESGKQVKHRTCRFFSVFSTRRWWRFQAFR
ncbi:hypothetical protein CXB65_00775 [Pseudomonas monteilii]|uniref:Uncharacterized protein n=1 Tax=Pseudomonas monteilii TaxID=76759 RepID=A0A2N1IZ87_9PSED|nr:hypothetical protein B7H19_22845 [Pseudomonas putida]PKI26046.1 hypothetical protein CXB65_00775 [Pseudomonas monteilii]TFW23815.1 hypothetical protein E4L40_11520 [Pseudomonas putida]